MKILLELPTWLGDTVMATPAIESLLERYSKAEITIYGSFIATEVLRAHPRISHTVVDHTREGFRLWNIYRTAKTLGPHDLALSFRSHFSSTLLLHLTRSKQIYQYKKSRYSALCTRNSHQVEFYQYFIDSIIGVKRAPGPLRLDWTPKSYSHPTVGINPGATYGSAKRWDPERFAQVAAWLSDRFDILLFGGPKEIPITKEIEKYFYQKGGKRILNLAGKTDIAQLCSYIGGVDLFITNDSGPMHIAAAYKIPTVAIFGPTRYKETSQWMNPHALIVRKELECSPCMKRRCPLGHHACMKEITAYEVFEKARELLKERATDP